MDEEVSALVDGALDETRAQQVAHALGRDERLRGNWALYHVIGECVRREPAAPAFDIASRVMQQLDAEPVVLAPPPARKAARTLMLPAMAAMLGMGAVAWVALSMYDGADGGRGLIAAAAPKVEAHAAGPMQEASLQEYLLAHQGVSPSTGMQGVAPYVRSVADVEVLPAMAAR
ncbi:MAG: sigma-E factor negative regulatory protein [Rhodocyclaceae bacterium]|nr:sigma-E factor negative regulatory protein [Rhodocyclaceae bacterium]MBX3668372.1 sigma-E factor negative regulatory protein [Rhodocyclaceae bacterium]